jgi:pimeloyl-ACP methyl ester carboxylesterase
MIVNGLTFILIPGAGGSAWYWHLVVPELRQRGHDAVAVELPAADDRAGLPQYVETVLKAIGDRTNLVLVAQSMAGFTAPLVCAQVSVQLLVLVNAMIPKPGETPGEWWGNTGQAEAKRANDVREGRVPDAELDLATEFFHDVPRDIFNEALKHGAPQSGAVFESRFGPEAWPRVPTRVLVGQDDRFFPADFQRRVAQERLGITPDELPGGHLVALSRPKELAECLAAYAADLPRA